MVVREEFRKITAYPPLTSVMKYGLFGRLKDWRRVAAWYDRCPTVFFSAIALAATVIFSL